jgi:hypothetical protein
LYGYIASSSKLTHHSRSQTTLLALEHAAAASGGQMYNIAIGATAFEVLPKQCTYSKESIAQGFMTKFWL